jgi:hypothetical protein
MATDGWGSLADKMLSARQKEVAFQAWVEKKNETQKKMMAERAKEREQEEIWLQEKKARGKLAYERWMKKQLLADDEMSKQMIVDREATRLWRNQKEKRMKDAQEEYEKWKKRKMEENEAYREECRRGKSWSPPPRAETPSLPGYCSVWSCDSHMSRAMLRKVRHSRSYSLSELSTADNDIENNTND